MHTHTAARVHGYGCGCTIRPVFKGAPESGDLVHEWTGAVCHPCDPSGAYPRGRQQLYHLTGEDVMAALSLVSKVTQLWTGNLIPSLQDWEATPMILPRCAMRARCRKEMGTCMWGGDTGARKWARARRTLRCVRDHSELHAPWLQCTPSYV